ncbi:hypothetical protein ACLQ28_25265 [Micromonospora sp. DT201]|uniref:hypothetical protein n=1 Tax=Micromonospora sp. DT201 TaxID=3393442 RepID=UPI003CFB8350
MQPVGPYRFTEAFSVCKVGMAWWAIDGQDRLVTVAVLEGAAAADQQWRQAFASAASAMAHAPGGQRYVNCDFTAARPWVAYPAQNGMGAQRLFEALGMELHPPTSASEVLIPMPDPGAGPSESVSAPPQSVSAPPASVSAPPQSVSAPPQSVSAPPQSVSAPPQSVSAPPQPPWAAQPWAMSTQPVSGQPVSVPPLSVSGVPASPLPPSTRPVSAAPQSPAYADHAGPTPFDPLSSGGRRIAPVAPKPKRPKWFLIAGALVLVLLAGAAGFFVGRSGDDAGAPSTEATLAPFEATQLSINKTKFEGELAPLAEPWLAQAGGCAAYNDLGAPFLPANEKRHIFCHYGGAFLHFVLYPDKKEKDAARAFRLQLNLAGGTLSPGLREATRTTGNISGVAGSYLEYVFKLKDGRVMCGIWWDRDDTDAVTYIETLCQEGIAGNWDALRDLWRRGS